MQVAKATGCARTPWRRGCRVGAVALALATTGAWAGQASAPFAVTVNLRTGPETGTCQSSPESPARPSIVSIDCHAKPLEPSAVPSTPQVRDGKAFRFVIPTGRGDERYGGVDLYAGTGTITSWRVVHLSDWDYLEMTVGW